MTEYVANLDIHWVKSFNKSTLWQSNKNGIQFESLEWKVPKPLPHPSETSCVSVASRMFLVNQRDAHVGCVQTKVLTVVKNMLPLQHRTRPDRSPNADWILSQAPSCTQVETQRQQTFERQRRCWSETQLTFRDKVTVQQTGVRVNVVFWARRKRKGQRSTGETEC